MRTLMRRWAIRAAMRKPSPDRIPLSGNAARKRDYSSVHLGRDKNSREYLVRAIKPQGYDCLRFDPQTDETTEVSIPFSGLKGLYVWITQYYGEMQIDYHNGIEFITWNMLGIPHLALMRSRIGQALFNRKKLVRNDRNAVLRLVVDKTLDRRDFRMSPVGLMNELYGMRWALHPENDTMLNYYHIVLDSMVASGDLAYHQGAYKLEAQGLASLGRFEQEERHHRDGVRQQQVLAALTAALVLIGGLQAWDAWSDNLSPVPIGTALLDAPLAARER